MSLKRKRVFLLVSFLTPLIIAFIFLILFLTAEDPPVEVINRSQAAIGAAKDADAENYASRLLVAAESSHQMALDEWKYQNELVAYNRDFAKMRQHSDDATEKAGLAVTMAQHVKDSLKLVLIDQLKTVKHKVEHFDAYYAHLPTEKIDPPKLHNRQDEVY